MTATCRRAVLGLLLLAGVASAQPPAADFERALEDFRATLEKLVEADTTNPPGNEARAVAIVAARLAAEGIPHEVTEFAPGRQNVVARLAGDGSEKPLLLLAHLDVVGAEGQPWTSPPHRVTERDGFLVGRGVSDDLGMALVELESVILLRRSAAKLRRDVILALTGDEESGGAGIRWLLEHRPETVAAELALNEGGGVRLDERGQVRSVELQAAEKTYQDFALVARGSTGHSSVPLADNAIYRLARALERLGRHSFPVRLLPVTREYFRARAAVESGALADALRAAASSPAAIAAPALEVLEANPRLAATLRTTCVATTLGGGTRVNALPAEARANVNCRILPDENPADVARELARAIADPGLAIEPLESFGFGPPSALDGQGPRAVREVAAAAWPGAPVVPLLALGATDSRFLRARGIAAYGLNPIAMTESEARRAHGIDERIPLASLRPAIEFFHGLVLALAGAR
ncbi:MAG: M20/M25/M40 family metallo-hydrolase [Deltaproteobacteria bacterium]|nr:M20/M25/M40 family metallo-hydrolase [Deltaproteobacteria bacterium]